MPLIDASQIYQMTNVGDHIDGTDVYQNNPNLLDNAYFVGGGSQLGDGVFPINQKGLTTYTTDGANIDRWKQYSATVTLASDGVTVTPSAYSNNFLQLMNPAKWDALAGETVTLSIEVLAVTGTITVAGYNTGIGTITSTGIVAFTFTMPSGIADGNKFFGLAGQSGSSIKFGKWKLEIGTVSTLANDVPPNFAAEYEKCRYYLRYIPLTRYAIAIDGANAYMTMIGMPMAKVPTPSLITAGGVRDAGGQSTITSATVTGFANKIATVQFALSASRSYVVGYIYDTVLCLSAEL